MAKKEALADASTEFFELDTTEKIEQLLAAVTQQLVTFPQQPYAERKLKDVPLGMQILKQARNVQVVVLRAALNRIDVLEKKNEDSLAKFRELNEPNRKINWNVQLNPVRAMEETIRSLLQHDLPFGDADVIRLCEWCRRANLIDSQILIGITNAVENHAKTKSLETMVRKSLEQLLSSLSNRTQIKHVRKVCNDLEALLSGGQQIHIQLGEAWSDRAVADLSQLTNPDKSAWNKLLCHCQVGGSGKLSPSWQHKAEPLIMSVGFDSFKAHLLRWFPLVDMPRTEPRERYHSDAPHYDQLIIEPHVELLRGLAWCCGLKEDMDLARALTRLALSAYRKIPGKGPRLVSLGNACVTALGMMPGLPPIGQLAILKVKVKFGTAQKEIEKAFNASATREGLPRDEIEELAVPAYGLEEVGLRRESFGDYEAELMVDGSSASLHWLKEGKPIKSAPAAVKKEHPEELKELQAALKDVNAMLPAQRERLDTLYLAQKSWPLAVWRERYLDHPLIGTIARRLIWSFTSTGKTADGIWHDTGIVGVNGKPLNLKDDATVSLWHPIAHTTDQILGWRDWLERREVVQPFKQAHREVYLITDAERRTGTYSNRFAAHVLRQHQFNALCAARGWKNKLRLMVDDSYPPAYRLLPAWNLRAEYWIEGAGTEYGQDTNESGVFLYLATDQVRFYPIGAAQLFAHASGGGYVPGYNQPADEPLAVETLPPLVFSEIMRDVDLFVGVASVGNDPNWSDGGPGGHYRDYWQSYSFGELSATAQTRRALLERLIPRLKIADRCELSDRFLVVRGELRTYKIHLGSGNILMLPNDQYLCIVPKQTIAGHERVFLPFEGDSTLSIILSKAFLLAEDVKITDTTITSQLKR